jgi:hypothetical protein
VGRRLLMVKPFTRLRGAWTRIRNHQEECACVWCGFPFDVGERVYWRAERPYCGPRCADDDDRGSDDA